MPNLTNQKTTGNSPPKSKDISDQIENPEIQQKNNQPNNVETATKTPQNTTIPDTTAEEIAE